MNNAVDSQKINVIDKPDIKIEQLRLALMDVIRRAEIFSTHNIQSETLCERKNVFYIVYTKQQ